MTTRLGLSALKPHTSSAPFAAVGYVWHPADVFAPVREHVKRGGKTIRHEPSQQWLDVVVSVRAAGAALQPINTGRRPETALAAAWGREGLADQSTSPRVLEAFTPLAVAPLRTALAPIDRRAGRALHHPCAPALVCLDIDRTGLPAGRHAEASTQGDCRGEKPVMDANGPASVPRPTRNAWGPSSILATRRARRADTPPWRSWRACWPGRQPSGAGPAGGSTVAVAPRPPATGPSGTASRCAPQAIAATGRRPSRGRGRRGKRGARGPGGWRRPPRRAALSGGPRPWGGSGRPRRTRLGRAS